ncbi:hypothetical protein HUS23_07035 [Ectothiorhodospiraceae bacterium 2226]|nr:hypothetical protein HUS23_07035 [Ectothiorhodospiraceae bacterium 2226]
MGFAGWTRVIGSAVLLIALSGCDLEFIIGGGGSSDVTPSDWWKCPERLGGSWTFGRAPYGCDVEQFASAATVRAQFGAHIFDDEQSQEVERVRYMGGLYTFLGDRAAAYLRDRRSGVSDAEVEAWRHAVYTTAHQESFWTHYREAHTGLRRLLTMLRGDNGHGHGLMQIDDRWHTDPIRSGVGWHLEDNLIYALDIYYDGWRRAETADCVSFAEDWEARARAAYSAYNGGPAQICRWTDPNHRWSQNDAGFHDKYQRQEWLNYVAG